jgi:hypothetical protein
MRISVRSKKQSKQFQSQQKVELEMVKVTGSDVVADEGVGQTVVSPVLAVGLGRGAAGKSTYLNKIAQRALNQGRDVLVADFDPRSKTLKGVFPNAVVPESEEFADGKRALSLLLNRMVKESTSAVVDFGAGDPLLMQFGRELDLVSFCKRKGIQPLAIYVMGPEREDREHCVSIFEKGHFLPERMIIVMNEGAIREGRTVDGAFEGTMDHPDFLRMMEAGAKAFLWTRLPCMDLVKDRGQNFYSAASGDVENPLDPVEEYQVEQWLAEEEEKLAKLKIAGWLP